MGQLARAQVAQAKEAFATRNVELAQDLVRQDAEINQLNRVIFKRAVEIGDDLEVREWGMFMILVARCLERIGDNTVDIAEQVVFVVTGLFREMADASTPPTGTNPAGVGLGAPSSAAPGANTRTVSCLPLSSTFTRSSRSGGEPLQQLLGSLGEQDRVAGLPGGGLDPRGHVDGIADHAELEPARPAHVPGDHRARVQADAELQPLRGVELADDLQRCGERLVGVILLAAGSAEHRQQAVADELVDPAAVVMDDRDDLLEQPVDRGDHLFRRGALGERR